MRTVNIIGMTKQHCKAVARLHASSLTSKLCKLSGLQLLELYYAAASTQNGAAGYVAVCGDEIAGYVLGVWSRKQLCVDIINNTPIKFGYWLCIELVGRILRLLLNNDRTLRQRRIAPANLEKYVSPIEYELRPIVVSEKWRGQGIAQKLIKELIDDAARRGYKIVYLHVESSNTVALQCYEKMGFNIVGKDRGRIVMARSVY